MEGECCRNPPGATGRADPARRRDPQGEASYYSLKIGDEVVPDAAWYYPQAYEKAKDIEGYVAFYKNKVDIVDK